MRIVMDASNARTLGLRVADVLRARMLVACVLACAVALASGGAHAGSAGLAAAEATPRSESADRGFRFVGVNVDLERGTEAELDRTATRLAAAGVLWVRQPVRWARIERSPGSLDWARLDRVAAALDRHGLRMLGVLTTAPEWARRDPPPPTSWWLCDEPAATRAEDAADAPPTDTQDLARFAAKAASRYPSVMPALEVWPEANILPHWRKGGPDPEEYSRLLLAVATEVRRAAPGTWIVSGAPAPNAELGVCYLSDLVFLDRLALTGALQIVDAVGIAPYGLRVGPDVTPTADEPLVFRRAEEAARVLSRRGVEKPLWATAWGWRVGQGGEREEDGGWGGHDADRVARWIREGHAKARAEWPWLEAMFVWHLQPDAPAGDPVWGFALWSREGNETPGWRALVDIASVRPAPALATSEGTGSGAQSGGRPDGDAAGAGRPAAGPGAPRGTWVLGLALGVLVVALLWLAGGPVRRRPRPRAAWSRLRAWHGRLVSLPTGAVVGLYVAGAAASAVGVPLVSILGCACLVVAAAASPAVAVAGSAAAVPLWARAAMHAGPVAVRPVELLVLVACAGAVADALLGRGPESRRGPGATRWPDGLHALDWVAVFLVGWAALSPLWAEYPGPALREWRTVIAEPVLLYLVIRAAPRPSVAVAALDGLVLGSLAASLWALGTLALSAAGLNGGAVAAEGVWRANGPYASPNNLALLLGRVVPLLAAVGLWGEGRRRHLYRAAALPVFVALVATFSRGALLVGLPVLALYLVVAGTAHGARGRAGLTARFVGAATLVVAALLPFAHTQRVRGALDLRPGSTPYIRLRLWSSAIDMIRDHPWRGVGLDNFLYLYQERYVKRDAAQERFLSHPHNVVLDWWTRLGVPGVAVMLVLVVGNGAVGWKAIRNTSARGARALAVGALGMQVYAVSHGMVDNSFFLVDLAVVWWVAQAFLLAAAAETRTGR